MIRQWPLDCRNPEETERTLESNVKVAKLEKIVDSLEPFVHNQGALAGNFVWLDHEPYDKIRLTTAMNESFVEATVFK